MKTKNALIRLFSLAFALLFAFTAVLPAFAEEDEEPTEGETEAMLSSQSVVTSYEIKYPAGKIEKDRLASIEVNVKNLQLKTEDCGTIDITRTVDSFKDGRASVKVTSSPGQLLTFTVTFINLVYTGRGQSLDFIVLYKGTGLPHENLSVTVGECVEYTEPVTEEVTKKEPDAPNIVINRSDIGTVKPGDAFTVTVTFNNLSSTAATDAVATFEPSEGLAINEKSFSKTVGKIAGKGSAKITVNLKALPSAASASQTLSVNLKYNYAALTATAQGTADEKLNIPLAISGEAGQSGNAATPNIIVSNYSYGGSPIAAGDTFSLSVTFKNTSAKLPVDNIVMSLETGENLSITSSSNTFYFSSLPAGGSKTQTVEMQVPANAAVTGAKADISFKYEYVLNGERASSSASESLSIPVYLPDRFSVTEPEAVFSTVGEETDISLPYVNRGKGEISNVEAVIEFDSPDSATCEMPKQNLGNFEAGKSGTIDFFFTPNMAGEMSVKLIINYEDEMTQPKSIEIPLTFTVEDMIMPSDEPEYPGEYEEPEESGNAKKIVLICAVAAVLAAVIVTVIIIVLKKKKKAKVEIPDSFDWEDANQTNQR
ncbi:MAG: hypothetical protein SPI97_09580 [Oscillospiraceae bacterium]|nr:hypothetical protein [Oscillospiraceae bacterium]